MPVFDHISIGVTDPRRSRAFYDLVLAPLGLKVLFEEGPEAIGYGRERPEFWLDMPLDETKPANPGNGTHIAFTAPSRAAVEAFHAAALAAGGQDAGAPGLRLNYEPHYYAAFVYDPDGHKIEAVCRT